MNGWQKYPYVACSQEPRSFRKFWRDWIFHYGEKDFYQWAITVKGKWGGTGGQHFRCIQRWFYKNGPRVAATCVEETLRWHKGVTSEEEHSKGDSLFYGGSTGESCGIRHDPRNVNSRKSDAEVRNEMQKAPEGGRPTWMIWRNLRRIGIITILAKITFMTAARMWKAEKPAAFLIMAAEGLIKLAQLAQYNLPNSLTLKLVAVSRAATL